jgi:hypothetical protein
MADDDKIRLEMDSSGFVEGAKEAQVALSEVKGATDDYNVKLEELKKQLAAGTISYEDFVAKEAEAFKGTTDVGKATEETADPVQRLKQRIAELNEQLVQNARQYAAGATSLKEYRSATAAAQTELAATRTAITALEGATVQSNVAAREATMIFRDLATGRVYGLAGHVERLTESFIGPGGLGMAIGAGAMALYYFGPKVLEAINYLSGYDAAVKFAKTSTDELGDRIKEINENPLKTIVEVEELDAAKKQVDEIKTALQEVERLRKQLPPGQKTAGQRAGTLLDTSWEGGEALASQLTEAAKGYHPFQEKVTQLQQERAAKEAETAGILAAPGLPPEARALAKEQLKKDLHDIDVQIGSYMTHITEDAGRFVGEALKAAREGKPEGRADIVAQLRAVGQDVMAQQIEAATPINLMRERVGKVVEAFSTAAEKSVHTKAEAMGKAAEKAAHAQEQHDAKIAHGQGEIEGFIVTDSDRAARERATKARQAAAEATREQGKEDRLGMQEGLHPQLAMEHQRAAELEGQGYDRATAAGIAKRQMELMSHGILAIEASNEAMREQQLLSAGLIDRFNMARIEANRIAQNTQKMLRQMDAGAQDWGMMGSGLFQ